MAYSDGLGILLDRLTRDELEFLGSSILGIPKSDFTWQHTTQSVRENCSAAFRSAAGHSMVNLFRDRHDFQYEKITRLVAEYLKVQCSERDDFLILEHRIIAAAVARAWDKMSDVDKERIVSEINSEISKKAGINFLLETKSIYAFINSLIKNPEMLGVAGVLGLSTSYTVNAIAGVIGWNALEAIVFQAIFRYVGFIAACEALLGIGFWGGVMSVTSRVIPVLNVATSVFVVHKICDTAYRKIVPGVVFVASKRIEKFPSA